MSRPSPPSSSSATGSSLIGGQLGSGVSSLGYTDPKRWTVVYPHYLNSARSVSEGRRVPLRFALERPSVADVVEACQSIQLPFALEQDKSYSRDAHSSGGSGRGRVRVQLYAADHSPLSSDVRSKQQLLCRIGEVAPTLKMRALRVEVEKKREEKEMKELQQLLGGQAAASSSSSSASASGANSGSSSPSGSSTPISAESGSAKKNKKNNKKK